MKGTALVAPIVVDRAAVSERLQVLIARGERAAGELSFEHAAEMFDAAHVLATATQLPGTAAESLAGLGYVAHLRGELEKAQQLYTAALPGILDRDRRAFVRTRLAFAHYDRGDIELAASLLAASQRDTQSAGIHARVTGFLGNLARARGEHAQAIAYHAEATRTMEGDGNATFAATFAMDRAITLLLAGDLKSAVASFDTLTRSEAVVKNPQLATLVDHYAFLGHQELELPFAEPVEGKSAVAGYLQRARRSLTDLTPAAFDELESSVPANAHARITLQLLTRVRLRRDPPGDARALIVSRSGAYFRLGRELVMLRQRVTIARLLMALVHARLATPGAFIEWHRLAERTWSGERILPAAAKNRLHVAVATLRKLGLGQVLESSAGGYRIDRDVTVVVVD